MRPEPSALCASRLQRGQAVFALLILLGLGVLLLTVNLADSAARVNERARKTDVVMAQVRDALIGWSASQGTQFGTARPGDLPCPDTDEDGYEQGTCAAGRIGRVPWRTLGIPEPKDEWGETLWYSISGSFRKSSMTSEINSDTLGTLTVHNQSTAATITTQAIAVIFSPGPPLGGQSRSSSTTALCSTTGTTIAQTRCAANYLETAAGVNNSTTNGPFISATATSSFNDRVMAITGAQLMPVVEQRVARELRTALQTYRANCGSYPFPDISDGISNDGLNRGRIPALGATPCSWPAAGVTLPQWFTDNNWRWVIYYAVAMNQLSWCYSCTATTLSLNGVSGYSVVIIMPSAATGIRTNWPNDWFDDAENRDDNDDNYVRPTSTAYSRDRIFTIP